MSAESMAEAFAFAEAHPDVYRDAARDPRLDPRAGDVLAVRTDVRCVLARDEYRVTYTFPHKSAERTIPLVVWHAWARGAEVRESAS